MLVSQTVRNVVTDYLLDVESGLWQVIAATTGANTNRYLHGPTGIHAHQDNTGTWQYMLPDALGSVRELIQVVDDRMRYYNDQRRHSSLDYRPPVEVLRGFIDRR